MLKILGRKQSIGKTKLKNNTFPRRMIINEIETFNDDKITAGLKDNQRL